jgi:hypothetical protein
MSDSAMQFYCCVRTYGGAFTPYTAGMDGRVPMVQTVLAF